MMKLGALLGLTALMVTLAACGGGGGSEPNTATVAAPEPATTAAVALTPTVVVSPIAVAPITASSAPAVPVTVTQTPIAPTPTNPTPAPIPPVTSAPSAVSAAPLAQYAGIWNACSGYVVTEHSFSTPDAQGRGQLISKNYFYSLDDPKCAGMPYATLIYPTYSYSFDGTKTLSTGEVVDKLIFQNSTGIVQIQGNVIYTNSTGVTNLVPVATVTAGTKFYITDTKFPGNTVRGEAFIPAAEDKAFIVFINGKIVISDQRSARDAQGYPTTPNLTRLYTLTK